MQQIESTQVTIKTAQVQAPDRVLVHDGVRVILLTVGPGQVATGSQHQLLVGTQEELEAEVARLNLLPPPERNPAQAS